MKRAVFRYIEAELYDYHQTKKTLEELKLDIIEEGPQPDLLVVNGEKNSRISNPTLNKTTRLLTNKRITKMTETIRAIERVCDRLPEEKQELVRYKYWDGRWSNQGVADKLNVSLATYYRWRRDVVFGVAIELGLAEALEAG